MVVTARDLAAKVSAIRQTHARALQADLSRLETRYGREALNNAMGLSRERELRATMSTSGRRQRQHARGEDMRMAAEEIFRKPEQE
jgi:hypothetical protein